VYCFGSLEQRIGILKILKKFKIKNVIEIFLYLSVDNAYRLEKTIYKLENTCGKQDNNNSQFKYV